MIDGETSCGLSVLHLDTSFAAIVNKLLQLGLIEVKNAALGHLELHLGLELVFVTSITVAVIKVHPVLNASDLMVGVGGYDLLTRWEMHLV